MTMNASEEDQLPDDINLDKIEEGLYLGNLSAAVDVITFKKYHISHILTIDSKPLPDYILNIPGMEFLYIQVDDMSHEDLLSHFKEITTFILDGQAKGNVLVHCFFGVSRSACAVIAHLMKKYKLSVDEAMERVKSKRRCVGPNSGFMAQLVMYYNMHYEIDVRKNSYKLFRLQKAVNLFKKGQLSVDYFNGDPFTLSNLDVKNEEPFIKCRNCRLSLVTESSLVKHLPVESPNWFDPKWNEEFNGQAICMKGLFLLPCEWMKNAFTTPQGKINCPKCNHKLGSFDWMKGSSCPCNATLCPGFIITPSKVDIIRC